MSDAHRDQAEGKFDETTGKAKSAWGDLTGDDQKRAEGDADQAEGRAKQAMGDVKEAADTMKDKASDAFGKITNR
ncbi:MAG: CsbD family protein [Chloroflexota bacterium]|nr:CsbD family protein [Chloroflexota bacterium]